MVSRITHSRRRSRPIGAPDSIRQGSQYDSTAQPGDLIATSHHGCWHKHTYCGAIAFDKNHCHFVTFFVVLTSYILDEIDKTGLYDDILIPDILVYDSS